MFGSKSVIPDFHIVDQIVHDIRQLAAGVEEVQRPVAVDKIGQAPVPGDDQPAKRIRWHDRRCAEAHVVADENSVDSRTLKSQVDARQDVFADARVQIADQIGLRENCVAAVKDFALAVYEGRPAPIPGEAGVAMIVLEEAVYRSAETGTWEQVT